MGNVASPHASFNMSRRTRPSLSGMMLTEANRLCCAKRGRGDEVEGLFPPPFGHCLCLILSRPGLLQPRIQWTLRFFADFLVRGVPGRKNPSLPNSAFFILKRLFF